MCFCGKVKEPVHRASLVEKSQHSLKDHIARISFWQFLAHLKKKKNFIILPRKKSFHMYLGSFCRIEKKIYISLLLQTSSKRITNYKHESKFLRNFWEFLGNFLRTFREFFEGNFSGTFWNSLAFDFYSDPALNNILWSEHSHLLGRS